MNWVVYIISFIAVNVGAHLVQYGDPIWGAVLLGLAIVLARLSGMMQETKRNN